MVVHAAGESGPAPAGTYAVVLACDGKPQIAAASDRLQAAGIEHKRIVETEGPYAGQLLAIGIPPQPRAAIRRVLSSTALLR